MEKTSREESGAAQKCEEHSEIINNTIGFVKKSLEGNDASHDWRHIERVWNLTKTIAAEEKVQDLEICELGALLHDIEDWKYSGSDTAGAEAAKKFLEEQKYDPKKTETVLNIIQGVGFKEELKPEADRVKMFPELMCVQDADRLDAIGAIGIARCLTFGGSKKRKLYDPDEKPKLNLTKEEYKKHKGPTINHFHEKLLKLKDMMKTASGRKVAAGRHQYMVEFLDRFNREVAGEI